MNALERWNVRRAEAGTSWPEVVVVALGVLFLAVVVALLALVVL